MASWNITDADRNPNGRVRAPGFDEDTHGTAFAAALDQSLSEVGATSAAEPPAHAPAAPWTRAQIALTIGSVVLVLASLAALFATARPDAAPHPLATPLLPGKSATVADLPVPAAGARLPRAIVAYAAPVGEPLGAIEAGRAYTATATYGAAWVRLDVAGSGLVWVRAGELPEVSRAGLADLAPPPTPVPPPPASAPPAVIQPVAPAAPEDCDPAVAPYVVHRQVEAFGSVDGCSYKSTADAGHNADLLEADLRANAGATREARATPTTASERGER